MRRLTVPGVLAVLVATACGGGEAARSDAPAAKPASATPQQVVVVSEPTPEQLAAREKLLREIAAGTYDCDCTGTARHLDRVRSAKAKAAEADRPVSAVTGS